MTSISKHIIVVSGLPRSGTSMMMKMLKAGGVETLINGEREADENNPMGYYEFGPVKRIKEDASWIQKAEGKAVKVVSPLLCYLPRNKSYKVIFMKRKLSEILTSQRKMLERMGAEVSQDSDKELVYVFKQHLEDIKTWLAEQPNMDVIYVNYNEVILDPWLGAQKVVTFLGGSLNVQNMVGVINKSLYRERE